jgi:uncharacterized protein (DUF2141 family)
VTFEGATVNAIVIAAGVIVDDGSATIQGGNFTISWPDILVAGTPYRVAFFADGNGDGYCVAPDPDGAWQVDVPDGRGDRVVKAPYAATSTPEVCAFFETPPPGATLTLDGVGFDAEEGKTVHGAALLGGTVKTTAEATVTGGAFTLTFEDLAPGDYTVDLYADIDGDSACSAADHAWRALPSIPLGSGDQVAGSFLGSAPQDPSACGSFQ